jgi:hypothetical protein
MPAAAPSLAGEAPWSWPGAVIASRPCLPAWRPLRPSSPCLRISDHLHCGAVAQGDLAGGDHLITGRQAITDLHPRALGVTQLDRNACDLAFAHPEHRRLTVVEQRQARYDQRIGTLVVVDADATEHAGLQRVRGAVEGADHAKRAAARIHHRRDAIDGAGEALARQRVGRQRHRLAGAQGGQLALGHVEGGFQPRVVDDAEDRRVDLHEVAGLDRARCDHAGDRRHHRGVGQLQRGQAVLRADVFQVVAQLVDIGGADHLLADQLLCALVVVFQLAHLRFALCNGQPCTVRVQPHQRLAGGDPLPFLDQHRQRHAGGLGDHLRLGAWLQRGGAGVAGRDGTMAGHGHFDRDRVDLLLLLGLGSLGFGIGPCGATAQQQGGGDQQCGSADSAATAGQEGWVRHRQVPGGCVDRCGSKVMHHFTATPYPKGHGAFTPLVGPPPFQLDET